MKRAFKMKYKAFWIFFIRLSVAKNCFRPESGPLIFCENILQIF